MPTIQLEFNFTIVNQIRFGAVKSLIDLNIKFT